MRAVFPGGSITGAPKIRAMEIIDELEPNRRGLYTGAVGYFSRGGSSAFNIAIRTMLVEGDRVSYQVGGGIVADSDPEAEYEETLHKGRGIEPSWRGGEGGRAMIWVGGKIVPDEALAHQRPRPDLRARPRPLRDLPDLGRPCDAARSPPGADEPLGRRARPAARTPPSMPDDAAVRRLREANGIFGRDDTRIRITLSGGLAARREWPRAHALDDAGRRCRRP